MLKQQYYTLTNQLIAINLSFKFLSFFLFFISQLFIFINSQTPFSSPTNAQNSKAGGNKGFRSVVVITFA